MEPHLILGIPLLYIQKSAANCLSQLCTCHVQVYLVIKKHFYNIILTLISLCITKAKNENFSRMVYVEYLSLCVKFTLLYSMVVQALSLLKTLNILIPQP